MPASGALPGVWTRSGEPERVPAIGVVVPSFNQARFIPACLESIRMQEMPALDTLVMDGGSTDGTMPIVERTIEGLPGFRAHSGPDGGQADAINRGMARVSGDWIAWLNSDDYYLPGGLRALARSAEAHPRAAAIFGRALMVDRSGHPMREYPTKPWSIGTFRKSCWICQPAVLIRRSAWEAAGGLDERLQCCLDYDLWFRLAEQGEMVFCDRLVAASRHYPETKTASRRLRALVEAGRLLQRHAGSPSWRWGVKWALHRWTLDRSRFTFPIVGQVAALRVAHRYNRRFRREQPSRPQALPARPA